MKRKTLFNLLPIMGLVILGLALGLLDPKNSVPTSVQAQSPKIKIMPLGDSITEGLGSAEVDGYRCHLYQSLTPTYTVDFVGSQQDGPDDCGDRDHEGHRMEGADFIQKEVYGWLNKLYNDPEGDLSPDIVLLHIGTNDIRPSGPGAQNQKPENVRPEIEGILDEIDGFETEKNKEIVVILARIINIDPSKHEDPLEAEEWKSRTSDLNEKLQQMTNEQIANGDRIIVVNMEKALDSYDDMFYSDGFHPNDKGYKEMAKVWLPAVEKAISILSGRIVVNTNDLIVNPDDGLCSLIEAITAANTDTASGVVFGECAAGNGADIISLEARFSSYRLTAVDNTPDDPNGLPSITSEITIRNNHAFASRSFIVRSAAPGTPDFRIFHVAATGNLTLEEVAVENGRGDDGGGIFNRGIVTLDDSEVCNNKADGDGGGIYNYQGTAALIDSDILANVAGEGSGISGDGGGIYNYQGTVILTGKSRVVGNKTQLQGGGILNNGRDSIVMLTNSTVDRNQAGTFGGGIANRNGTVTLIGSTISYNEAINSGGGIDNDFGGLVRLTNSTISSNNAGHEGGGIATIGGAMKLINSTISSNSANDGGGIFSDHSTVVLTNTIVSKQILGGSCSGMITSNGYNLVSNITTPCVFTPTIGDKWGTSDNPMDPMLSELQDHGGPTFTHGLMRRTDPESDEDSPAIDAIPAARCPLVDQRGRSRRVDIPGVGNDDTPFCDIGAFERQEGETAIDLLSFTAEPAPDHVTLAWETGTEVDNAGFNIWRSEAAQGPYTKLNDALIPAEGDPVSGASYVYVDIDVVEKTTYYYKLEDVDIRGVTTLHGPVSARVRPRFRRLPYRPTLPGF